MTGGPLSAVSKSILGGGYGGIGGLTVQPDTYPTIPNAPTGGFWMFNDDGTESHFSYSSNSNAVDAYRRCAPLTAVVNRKAQAYINGKTWVINTQGKGKGKEATGELASKIKALLAQPNPLQSWKEFEAQQYIYQQVFGYCVVLPIKPTGFGNEDATRLWNIPPYMLTIIEKPNANILTAKSWMDFIDSVTLVWGGMATPLNLNDIFIFKDFTPNFTSFVLPESRIRSLQQVISNVIGTYESRGVLINKRGPSFILSSNQSDVSGNVPLSPDEKKATQEEFGKLGLRRFQMQAIITSAAVKVDTVGFSTKDLMLFEEVEDDIMRICDNYTFPYQLLASSKGTTFANVNDAKKLLYQDSIIPEADSMYDQWNAFFGLTGSGIVLQKDYKHIAALQEDQVNEATARFQRNRGALIEFNNNLLTLNEWRELNGDDPITGTFGDLYYYQLVAEGFVFGSMANATGGVQPDPNNGSSATGDNQNNGGANAN